GTAQYELNRATEFAAVGLIVRDDWKGLGVGTILMRRLIEVAKTRGVQGFAADVPASNRAMLSIFYKSGLEVRGELREGVHHLETRFPSDVGSRSFTVTPTA
ncbi:MAG: N-acetyltransferase family protein, partial [Myxococcaceae bacterium]